MDKKEIIASLENELETLEKEYQENIDSLKRTINILKSDKDGSLLSVPEVPATVNKSDASVEKVKPQKSKKRKWYRCRSG